MNSKIIFRWNRGLNAMEVVEMVRVLAESRGLSVFPRIDRIEPDLYCVSYLVEGQIMYDEIPLPPLNFKFDGHKCRSIGWALRGEAAPRGWASFYVTRVDGHDPERDCFIEDRLQLLRMFIDEDYTPWRLELHPEFLDGAIEKYHEAKRLFSAWDCDVVEAISEKHSDIADSDPDPGFEGRLFRFAKEGRKILYRPMEERRMITEQEVSDGSWRVVID